jgi:hypothetical protein
MRRLPGTWLAFAVWKNLLIGLLLHHPFSQNENLAKSTTRMFARLKYLPVNCLSVP